MKFSMILSLLLALVLVAGAGLAAAQEPATEDPAGPAFPDTTVVEENAEGNTEEAVDVPAEEPLTYDDYKVKAYSLSFFGGQFSGARYLDNKILGERTILTEGAGDIMGYDGNVLRVSLDTEHYTGAQKEIDPGTALGGRIGIYISDYFHLDLMGTYAQGSAVTTMFYREDPDFAPDKGERVEVDRDDGFKMLKGGLALTYDAKPASFFGIMPRLGFGLGGVLNTFTVLPDKGALYLEGNFSLNYEIVDNLSLGAQADITNFAFEVDELGYSNMVNYFTYSVGLTWLIDVIPEDVRAAHLAEKEMR